MLSPTGKQDHSTTATCWRCISSIYCSVFILLIPLTDALDERRWKGCTDVDLLINTWPLWWQMAWFISPNLTSLFAPHCIHKDTADAKFLTSPQLRQVSVHHFDIFNPLIGLTYSSHDMFVCSGVVFPLFLCVETRSNAAVYCVTLNVRAVPSHNTRLWFRWTKSTSMWQDCRGHGWIKRLLTASRVTHQQLVTDTPEI